MVVIKCPICPFVTPDTNDDEAGMFLAFHGNEHAPNLFPQMKWETGPKQKAKCGTTKGKVPAQNPVLKHRKDCKLSNTTQSGTANPKISANTKPQAMVASLIASNMQYIPTNLTALPQETNVSKSALVKTVLPDPEMANNPNNVVNPVSDKQICMAKVTAPETQEAKAQTSAEVINSVLPDLDPLAELIAYCSRVREERITQAELPEVGKKAPGSSHIEAVRVPEVAVLEAPIVPSGAPISEADTLEATTISAAVPVIEVEVSEASHVPSGAPISEEDILEATRIAAAVPVIEVAVSEASHVPSGAPILEADILEATIIAAAVPVAEVAVSEASPVPLVAPVSEVIPVLEAAIIPRVVPILECTRIPEAVDLEAVRVPVTAPVTKEVVPSEVLPAPEDEVVSTLEDMGVPEAAALEIVKVPAAALDAEEIVVSKVAPASEEAIVRETSCSEHITELAADFSPLLTDCVIAAAETVVPTPVEKRVRRPVAAGKCSQFQKSQEAKESTAVQKSLEAEGSRKVQKPIQAKKLAAVQTLVEAKKPTEAKRAHTKAKKLATKRAWFVSILALAYWINMSNFLHMLKLTKRAKSYRATRELLLEYQKYRPPEDPGPMKKWVRPPHQVPRCVIEQPIPAKCNNLLCFHINVSIIYSCMCKCYEDEKKKLYVL